MATQIRLPRFRPLVGRIRLTPRFAVGAAWFFILFSLAHLAWVVGVKWGDPSGLTTLYQTTVATLDGPETHRAWGMAYDGMWGFFLAMVQGVVVVTATGASLRRDKRLRRIGHGVLIAWAALWMLNLVNLAGIDLRLDSLAQASVMTLLFGCTVYRACGVRATKVLEPAPQPLPEVGPLTSDLVVGSDRVREIERHAVAAETESKLGRVRRAARKAGALGKDAAKRAKPIAASIGRHVSDAGQWIKRKLRGSGVIPRRQETTS